MITDDTCLVSSKGWTLSHSTSSPRDTHIANEGTDALVTRKRHCALKDAERIDGDYNGSPVAGKLAAGVAAGKSAVAIWS